LADGPKHSLLKDQHQISSHVSRKEEQFMPTKRKEGIVEHLTEKLRRAKSLVLLEAQGLTVEDQIVLRKKLRANNMEFQVVKNTLFRIATHNVQTPNIDPILNGPTAVAFSYGDELEVTKAISEYVKTSKIVKIKAGLLGKTVFTATQVEELAKLPGAKEIKAQAVGTILGPVQKVAGLIGAPTRDLVTILRNYAEKQGATF
jgi:large subunit ribosomal protein L10